ELPAVLDLDHRCAPFRQKNSSLCACPVVLIRAPNARASGRRGPTRTRGRASRHTSASATPDPGATIAPAEAARDPGTATTPDEAAGSASLYSPERSCCDALSVLHGIAMGQVVSRRAICTRLKGT